MSCPTLWDPMDGSTPGFSVLLYLLEFAQVHVYWVGDTIQSSHPLPPLSPFAFNLSQHQGLFQWVDSSCQWPKCWSFSISPSNEYSGLISFRMDWLDLLAVHWTFTSLLQLHNSKPSILWCSAFFYGSTLTSVHDYQKTIALTIQTFVGKVMSFLFNMLSRFVITFLPRSKRLLISWLQSHPQWS